MPVNLPLPPPPEVASAAIQQQLPAPGVELTLGGTRLRISAPADLDIASLQRGLAGSRDLVDALHRLPYLVMAAGHLSVRTYYLQNPDGSLNVWLLPQPVVAVSGDPPLRKYFESLAKPPQPLTPAELEPARTLAGLHARRAGLSSTPKLVPDGDDGLRLEVPAVAGGDQGRIRVSYGNPGNRYVGRRFLDLEAAIANRAGTEATIFWRESDKLWEGGRADYHEHSGTLSQYLRPGLFTLEARGFDYRTREPGQPILDGAQNQYSLAWLAIPRADFQARWTTEMKVDYVDQSLRQNSDHSLVRAERYPSLGLTVQRTATATVLGRRLDYDLSVLLRQGLGESSLPGQSQLDYRLGRTGIGASWRLLPELAVEAQLAGQWSDDHLPDAQLWALGGAQFMRAWFPGVAPGDRGAYGRLSALYPRAPDGNWQLTPAAHLEWGRSDRDGSPDARLADAALSLDFRYRRHWSGSVGSALPISEDTDPRLREGARAGFFFRLTADF